MKPLRIGALLLIIGTTLLVATMLRAKTTVAHSSVEAPGASGPYLLEPRETTVVLRDVNPQNVTVSIVDAQSWQATRNISEVNPVFTVSRMRKLYSVTFELNTRGLYYIPVTTSTGKLADEVDMVVEQRGLAKDLLLISIIISIIGATTIATDRLKQFIQKKPKTKN